MRRFFAAVALFALPVMAQADRPLAKPVSWFMAHPAELRQTLAACHDNAAYARTATCGNAEAAASGLMARSYTGAGDLKAMMQDPRYWSANPIARAGEVAMCRNGTSLYPADCPAAAQSALQALQQGGR